MQSIATCMLIYSISLYQWRNLYGFTLIHTFSNEYTSICCSKSYFALTLEHIECSLPKENFGAYRMLLLSAAQSPTKG